MHHFLCSREFFHENRHTHRYLEQSVQELGISCIITVLCRSAQESSKKGKCIYINYIWGYCWTSCCSNLLQVQGEIKRKWRRWHLQRYMGSDTKYQHPSIGSSNNFSTQITMLTRCSPKTRRGSSSCHDDLSSIWPAQTLIHAIQNTLMPNIRQKRRSVCKLWESDLSTC